MRYLSVCSGIEAATVAWHPLGWTPAAFSEIEKFPRAVLAHHYPDTPLHGDFTTIGADEYGPVDLLVGGTPCQSFSIAGLRGGLDDDRGNLALEFLKLADRLRARWVVWENVPGVLSSNGGRDFGSILGGLVELGYGFAYRVLDAQFFGVAQRRRRVFVVGHIGDAARAAAVLFERHSLQGHSAPRREAGQVPAKCLTRGANQRFDWETEDFVTHSLRGEGFDASEDGTGRGTPLVPVAFAQNQLGEVRTAEVFNTINTNSNASGRNTPMIAFSGQMSVPQVDFELSQTLQAKNPQAVAFMENQRGELRISDQTDALTRGGGKPGQGYAAAVTASAVRRLTPVECERLQGFPDQHTAIPWRGKDADECPDGPRYKALGNSMAVPVMRWIGERIAAVDALQHQRKAA